jgi:hypothetical protein
MSRLAIEQIDLGRFAYLARCTVEKGGLGPSDSKLLLNVYQFVSVAIDQLSELALSQPCSV